MGLDRCTTWGPGFLRVEDRRAGLEAADYRFDGIEEKIYLACDSGATADQLRIHLITEGDEDLDAERDRRLSK